MSKVKLTFDKSVVASLSARADKMAAFMASKDTYESIMLDWLRHVKQNAKLVVTDVASSDRAAISLCHALIIKPALLRAKYSTSSIKILPGQWCKATFGFALQPQKRVATGPKDPVVKPEVPEVPKVPEVPESLITEATDWRKCLVTAIQTLAEKHGRDKVRKLIKEVYEML